MKAPVAVALIIVGGILIVTPALSDHFIRAQIVDVMAARRDMAEVTLHPDPMNSTYRFGCWLTGTIMIAVAVFNSRNPKPQ